MGSDDIFKRAKAKKRKDLQREANKKEEYDKFLIVSEDTKSSYFYIKDAVSHYRIQSANFAIIGLGKDPLDIVNEAEVRFNKELNSHRPDFNKVYCVFDRDTHHRYYNAISKIESLNKKINPDEETFIAITSDPCFELWLLIHFQYTTKLYQPTQKKSASNIVHDDLCTIFPDYNKGSQGIFKQLLPKLDDAIKNSTKLKKHCKAHACDSPLTRMGNLISYIRDLKA